MGGVADAAREACLPVHDDHDEDVRRFQRWTVFETPSTPWVPCSHPIGHVPPRSRQSPLHLPQSDLDSDGYSSQRPGARAPTMPLEFLAGLELRRRPAPLLACR